MRKIIGLFIGICCMILMAGIDVSSVSAAEVRDWKGSGVGVDPLYANDPFVQEYLEILEQGGISLYASPKKVEKISCKDIYEAGDYVTDLARRRGDAMQLSWIWEGESAPQIEDMLAEPYSAHQPYDTMSWSYWYDYEALSKNKYEIYYYISFNYYTSDEQHQQLLNVIDEAIEDLDLCNKKDYEQAELIHDFICGACDYDYDALSDPDLNPYTYTAYSALINGKAVCMGYARAFSLMCERVGLPAAYISGIGNGGGHAWNIVKIGDYYYNIDCTWDGQSSYTRKTFFLKNESDFGDHIRDEEYDDARFHAKYPMSRTSFTGSVPITDFSLNRATGIVTVGCDMQLEVVGVVPQNTTDSTKAVWSSGDSSVATVSADGLVFGIKEGSTVISCTISGITRNCTVWVTQEAIEGDFVINSEGVLLAYQGLEEDLQIPDTVTAIGAGAFQNNTFITDVFIPDTVTSVGDHAFAGCSGIESITIPESVSNIAATAFYECNLVTLYVQPDSYGHHFALENGIAYSGVCVEESLELNVGEKSQVLATYVSSSETSVAWSTSDDTIISVDEKGIVTAKTPGTAVITCKLKSGAVDQCVVTVKNLDSVTLNATQIQNWTIGRTGTFTPYVNGEKVDRTTMIWSSSNPEVATCVQGYLVGKSAGITTISCTKENGTVATCVVTVKPQDVITLNTNELKNWTIGRTGTFTPYVNGEKVDRATMTWSSSNPEVATCVLGYLVGKSAGTTTISCTKANGTVATCKVTVKGQDVITLNATEIKNWTIGRTGTFTPYVNGEKVDRATMTWSSSNPEVATCVQGYLVGKSAGTTTISCTKANGTVATCKVTVKGQDVITLNATEIKNWTIGRTGTFTPYVNGEKVDRATMTWSSSNPEVATVVQGYLVGKSAGTTTISCTKANGTVATCVVTVKPQDVVTLNTNRLYNWSVGRVGWFTAYVNGEAVNRTTMTWTSANPEIATCIGGELVGVGVGTTTITCTKANGTVATCTVTVK